MPWVGFEPTIPASERAKRVHALDRSATVTAIILLYQGNKLPEIRRCIKFSIIKIDFSLYDFTVW
jgi:hypothetical protein